MKQNKIDWRNLSDWRFITVGHHTGSTLEKKGILADHNYLDLTVCLQELEITSTTLFLGDSSTIDILKEEKIAGTKLISHEEKIVVEIPRLWQKTDLMYFPNSKSARLFLTALNNKELEIVKQKKIIVMGQKQRMFLITIKFL